MPDIYRGFEVVENNGLFEIRERGKLIDDAASETAAYDRIDAILRQRRVAEGVREYRNRIGR
jgi:hypothetical protein